MNYHMQHTHKRNENCVCMFSFPVPVTRAERLTIVDSTRNDHDCDSVPVTRAERLTIVDSTRNDHDCDSLQPISHTHRVYSKHASGDRAGTEMSTLNESP